MIRMKLVGSLLTLGTVACTWGTWAGAQTVERDTTITGPRGKTIQRDVEIKRGPGSIERQVQIKRPGGTLDRSVQVQRSPAFGPWRPPIGGPWPRPAWIPRPVLVGPPAIGLGLTAAPLLNFSFGGGGGGIGGGVGGPGPGMGGPGGPGPGGPAAGTPPPPDQTALLTQRLQSVVPSHRKDAAYALGQSGDPRAIPSLVHVLKYDLMKEVRVASAIALGEIGGSESAVALERCAIYDHKEEVRKAATTALERLNSKARTAPPVSSAVGPSNAMPAPPATSSPFRESPPPALEPPAPAGESPQGQGDAPASAQPPPPPTPVAAGPQGAGLR
jgi:hypothetical protein